MRILRSVVAVALACALGACAGGGDSTDGDASASGTPTQATSADAVAAKACTDTGRALAPLADGLAGGDLESALSTTEVPAREVSGTTPAVEMALARMEFALSYAKQAVERGVFGTEARSDLLEAYESLDEACAGVGAGF